MFDMTRRRSLASLVGALSPGSYARCADVSLQTITAGQGATCNIRCSYVCQGLLFFILRIGKILVLLSADTTGMGRSRWRAASYQFTRSAAWQGPGAVGRSIEGQHGGAAAEYRA